MNLPRRIRTLHFFPTPPLEFIANLLTVEITVYPLGRYIHNGLSVTPLQPARGAMILLSRLVNRMAKKQKTEEKVVGSAGRSASGRKKSVTSAKKAGN